MGAIGRRVYGLGAVVLGVPALVLGDFAALGLPVPVAMPGQQILLYASAGLLVVAGLATNAPRTPAIGALLLAAFFSFWLLALHLPIALAKPATWVSWEGVAETAVSALGGVLAYALAPGIGETRAAAIVRIVRPLFGVGLLVFGASEFIYAKFTASLVPDWLPPSQLFWTYATGAAQIAAGLAIVSGVRARLAAMLLTAMYVSFSLVVHLPRLIANPASHGNWAENGVNLILAGAAWGLAEALGAEKTRR
jgi:uncharacterized membrane protein YphA (DoxX/SURF4 family)